MTPKWREAYLAALAEDEARMHAFNRSMSNNDEYDREHEHPPAQPATQGWAEIVRQFPGAEVVMPEILRQERVGALIEGD